MPIYQKINAVMKAVKGVEKTRTNQHGKFKYAGHEDVNEALRGHFAVVGIVRCAEIVECSILDGGTIMARCLVTYTDVEDGTRIEAAMWAVQPSQTSGKTVTAQQIGQALSYAVKNVEFKLFALTGDNEQDSDSTESYSLHEAQTQVPGHNARAGELLKMFTIAKDLAEVDEVSAMCKAEWKDLKGVPGFAEAVVEIRSAAQKRLAQK